MKKGFYVSWVIALVFPLALFAGTQGKIKGKVVDSQSGEALVGASVAIVGTSFGSTTDVNGEYIISHVEVGTYVVRATYIGYQQVTMSNIGVSSDMTSEANFKLPLIGVVGQEVVIVARRPLINKSSTNAVRLVDADEIANLPARGIDVAIRTQPGVVQRNNGDTYIRGSRPDQTIYTLEGVGINNELSGTTRSVRITDAAVEQIQVQSGGYPAEFPGANGGIVSTSLKTGTEKYVVSLQGESDNYTSQGKKSLGGYSYGYSDYTMTIGGPIPSVDKLRFFAAVQNTFLRDPFERYQTGIDFTGPNALVAAAGFSANHPTTPLTDTLNVSYPDGNVPAGSRNTNTYSGTLLYSLGDIQLKGSGSYSHQRDRAQSSIANIFDMTRLPLYRTDDGFGQLKLTHFITPKISYVASASYTFHLETDQDPILGSNFESYGDPTANKEIGFNNYYYSASVQRYLAFPTWNVYDGTLGFNQPGTLLTNYRDERQYKFGGKVDFSIQEDAHTIKIGAEYNQGLVRRFLPDLSNRYYILNDPTLSKAEKEKQMRLSGNGTNNYGFDIYGTPINNDVKVTDANGVTHLEDFGPRRPTNLGVYVQDKLELSDLNINIGIRYDYLDIDSWDFVNPQKIIRDPVTGLISDSSLVKSAAISQVSPRVGFSFPVTERTKFHAQYGQFISPTKGSDSYRSLTAISTQIFTGGFFYSQPVGFGLKPERSTLYEIGFEQQFGENASLDITTYYKDIQDQVTFAQISPLGGAQQGVYQALINQDFATTKGVEFKLTLRRTNRIETQVNYTYSDARATGTGSLSLSGTVGGSPDPTFIPKFIFPTENNQSHRGSISVDYRFFKDDGGQILERSGLNLLFEFNSGYNYTRLAYDGQGNTTDGRFRIPLELLGSSTTPWYFRLDAKIDKAVTIASLEADFYLRATNLLNTQNAIAVFPRTGDARDDGWLSTQNGAKKAAEQGPQYVALYQAVYGGVNSGVGANTTLFDTPRQIVFGVKLSY